MIANYKLTYSSQFKKDFKKYQNKPKELNALTEVFDMLINRGAICLTDKMKLHHQLLENYNTNS
ncbi:type II toxin-antitoxin system YafQ family toxin [Sphingobacterium sp. MYb382]|uniref:type II toxin-antitoxin system YafQ family toxin n=1 Tax=Sphingobacterium sp. MYb382 TaxID=2745278 RepID=UPI00403F0464